MLERIVQKKIIFPGSQIEYNNLSDANEKYFAYCSTYMAFVFNKSNLTLKNILGEDNNSYISAISLNKSPNLDILALYYNKDILIYNLITSKLSFKIPFLELKEMNFNKDSKLLILNTKGELFVTKVDYYRFIYLNKVNINDNICTCYKWYPFNFDEFAYSSNKNKIYYFSLLNNNIDNNSIIDNIKNKFLSKCVHIKDDEDFLINIMDFYDLDENYKYLLAGTTNSKIYLVDLTSYEITNKFNKYGKTPIQYLFWLNNQPGSFISINEKSEKYSKWNVSKSNFSSIAKLSDYNITSLTKFDNESNFLVNNIKGEVFIFNEINSNIKFIIKDNHYKSILDLKVNPNDEDLFITASSDGNIRLYSIKETYKLIHIFNNKNNINCQITSLKWSPKHQNIFASGDSFLNLRIFDILIKKQISSYQCLNLKVNNNFNNYKIEGIDWNEYDNILVCINISILLFSFVINNKNKKEEYSLILLTDIKINNIAYNPIFEPCNEYIITPCENGNIYFYSTTNDKLGKIIDIFPNPSKEIIGHKKRINSITFNNSKTILASASEDMTIGLYNIIKSKETPMSRISNKINNFLSGQESPIIKVLFLIDDTLLSSARNGTVCIWDISKKELKYNIKENIGDIYSINSFNKYPFLFITSGKDCSIRFWNLNYKMNLEKLLKLDRKNFKEIEKFIKYYFYEEDFDTFFDSLNEPKKEKKLVSKYLEKNELIKNEYSKIKNFSGVKAKIDFSIKKEDKNIILDKLIKESAIIQEWEIFCELCILRNKWENALCFAPKVSIDYWQELMDRYEKYLNSEDYKKNNNLKENMDFNIQSNIDVKEIISLLNGNNYKKIIETCIKRKDFQNALIIWLMQKSKNEEDKISNKNQPNSVNINNENIINNKNNDSIINNSLVDNKINNLYNDIKMNFEKDENIKDIIDKESLLYLKEGKRVKSFLNYTYYDNKILLYKKMYQTNFVELGYLLCSFYNTYDDDLKLINDQFLITIYEKYRNTFNDDLLCLLINNISNEDYKYILCEILSNKNNYKNINLSKEKSELIIILEKNDYSSLQTLINKYKEECFNKLLDLFLDKDNILKVKEDEIKIISSKLSNYLRLLIILKFKRIELNADLQLDIVLSILFIECLNYNYKSLICLIIEFFITRNIFHNNKENNKKICDFIFNFIYYIQNHFKDNEMVVNYKLNSTHQQKYNSFSSSYNNHIINFDNVNKIRNILQFNDLYKCDIKEMKYFYLENEIYPRNVKNDDFLSSFSNDNIKSNIFKLESGNYASSEEYLEMNKFINIKTI